MIGIVVITHGHFGTELVRTAEDMVGRQERVTSLEVTSETGMESLCAALEAALQNEGCPEGCLILVDMLGGTPCNRAMLLAKDRRAEIVAGVNLYMVLSSFKHRSTLDLKALAARVLEDGRKAIVSPKELLLKRLE